MVLKFRKLQNSAQLKSGHEKAIYKQSAVHIELFRMVIESMLLVEARHRELTRYFLQMQF